MEQNTLFRNVVKKINPAISADKDLIKKLKDKVGIVKVIESKPGYRKYLTNDGEILTIQSDTINNENIYSGSVLTIEKSGGSGICEGILENICGPILKRMREYRIKIGVYGDLCKEKIGPHIEISDTSFYKNGGENYNRKDAMPLPITAYEKHGIPLDFKIKAI